MSRKQELGFIPLCPPFARVCGKAGTSESFEPAVPALWGAPFPTAIPTLQGATRKCSTWNLRLPGVLSTLSATLKFSLRALWRCFCIESPSILPHTWVLCGGQERERGAGIPAASRAEPAAGQGFAEPVRCSAVASGGCAVVVPGVSPAQARLMLR